LAKKFYAVRKGSKPGIYETWEECKAAIAGFSGAKFKSFSNIEDAVAYANNENVAEKKITDIIHSIADKDKVIAYIDGSYSKDLNRYAFGCVIITPNNEVIKESGCGDDPEAVLMNNVAGELLGSMYAAKWAIINDYAKIEIRHDYEGVAKWVLGEWKAKNKMVKAYVEVMDKFRKSVAITFTKVNAHSNDALNDEADKLAKEALISGKKAKVKKRNNITY